jgi:hypothetical protein
MRAFSRAQRGSLVHARRHAAKHGGFYHFWEPPPSRRAFPCRRLTDSVSDERRNAFPSRCFRALLPPFCFACMHACLTGGLTADAMHARTQHSTPAYIYACRSMDPRCVASLSRALEGVDRSSGGLQLLVVVVVIILPFTVEHLFYGWR